jgi:UDP-2,4-diacetamido-2,4,6-trideoxy-beta-L-altropyranose hydrolase
MPVSTPSTVMISGRMRPLRVGGMMAGDKIGIPGWGGFLRNLSALKFELIRRSRRWDNEMVEFLFRADASPSMGTGHIMRCLTMAEALHDLGHRCHFVAAELTVSAAQRLAGEGAVIHRIEARNETDAVVTCALARSVGAAAAIVDGYQFDEAWRRSLKSLNLPVLTFLDHRDSVPLHADIVVSAAGNAGDPQGRAAAPAAQWLFGPACILLRRELRRALVLPPLKMSDRTTLLVTFGGTDPACLTLPTVAALVTHLGSTVPLDVVIGGGVPGATAIGAEVAALGGEIRVHLDSPELGTLMRRAGLAVSAAGGTIGELAAFGVPAVIAVVAENQEMGARAAAADGWCHAVDARMGRPADRLAAEALTLWADPRARAEMAGVARGLVDGGGTERVVAALLASCAKV